MITLNDVTQRLDGTNFDTYRLKDLISSKEEMTEEEINGLKERLEYLECNDNTDEGFDEKLKLRSLL